MGESDVTTDLRLIERAPEPDPAFVQWLYGELAMELGLEPDTTGDGDDSRAQPLRWSTPRRRGGRQITVYLLAAALAILLSIVAFLAIGAIRQSLLTYTPQSEGLACPRFTPGGMACTLMVVPEDREELGGPSARVLVVRIPSTSKQPAPDPLVEIESPLSDEPSWIVQNLPNNPARAERDLIWIGYRGSGSATPSLGCSETDAAAATILGLPRSSRELNDAWATAVRACRDRLGSEGIDIRAYGSDAVQADVVDALGILGYREWNLSSVGLSEIALRLLRDRPDGLRAAVLDRPLALGAEPYTDRLRHLTASIGGLQDLCDRDPACAADHPDLLGDLGRQASAYEAAPADVEATLADGSKATVHLDGARRWEIAWYEIEDAGRLGLLPEEFAAPRSPKLDRSLASVAALQAGRQPGAAYGAYLSLVCREHVSLADRAAVEAAASGPVDRPMLPVPMEFAACDGWAMPGIGGANETFGSTIPTLAFAGGLDAQVPVDVGRAVGGVRSAMVVSAPNVAGRVGFGATLECYRSIRSAFLAAPSVRPDTDCLGAFMPTFQPGD